MAFPLGANADLYNQITQNLGRPPSLTEYNQAVRYVNAATGSTLSEFPEGGAPTPAPSQTPTTPPPAPTLTPPPGAPTGFNPQSGWEFIPGQGWVFNDPSGLGATQAVADPFITNPQGGTTFDFALPPLFEQEQFLLDQQLSSALELAQLAESGATARNAASIAAQQGIASQQLAAQLEQLRFSIGSSLTQALMNNDINRANLTLDAAQLAADPRSAVGFLEFLAQAGGGPTAISQNLAAGIEPSTVFDVLPQTEALGPEAAALLQTLEGFISGGR